MPIDLRKITRGREKRPIKVAIYSSPALGKTTFACSAPNAFVLDTDKGSHPYDVAQRVVPESWAEAKEWLEAVEKGSIKCDSLVVDSLTQFEAMAMQELFGLEGIASFGGGWGKGDKTLMAHWRVVMAQIERIWRGGKNVILTCHVKVKSYTDPMLANPYDRFQIALQEDVAGMVNQWSDYVLFLREDVVLQNGQSGNARAVSPGTRSIYTKRTPAYDAKARGISGFPERLPLSWDAFERAILDEESRTKAMVTEIDSALLEISDEKMTRAVREWLKTHPTSLVDTHNRVISRLREKREATAQTATSETQEEKI